MNDRPPLAFRAAALLAVDPFGLGGAVLRAPAGPARDVWLATLRDILPRFAGEDTLPWRRLPPGVAESRLIGGLDLAATLAAGRPVAERGLLAEADGGVLVVPMAERLEPGAAGLLAAALDTGEVVVERDGIALRAPARFACVLLDEGQGDERAPVALAERLAFHLDLDGGIPLPLARRGQGSAGSSRQGVKDTMTPTPGPSPQGGGEAGIDAETIAAAHARLPGVVVGEDVIEALAMAGLAFGVPSLRIATFALRAAKAAAALAGRDYVADEDAELAAALVLAPRATTLPATEDEERPEDAPSPEVPAPDDTPPGEGKKDEPTDPDALTDLVVEATRAAIPADLLAALSAAAVAPRRSAGGGRAGVARKAAKRGRPAGTRRGTPGHGVRLAIVETLRAAAPWQRLRRRQASPQAPPGRLQAASGRILVRRDDIRVGRFKEKSETLTLFVVDASGSAALHRLAEVKGAVELILADCYIRRDQVALIAFRGAGAELILPPTRSLVRAKRALAGQAGGGGTPLASAIEAAAHVTDAARRRGQTPLAVFLTDGKANIGRAGRPGRTEAEADALAAAALFRANGASGLVLDIAPRPGEPAARLASAMGARYIPLPYADARALSRAVMAGNV